ncbi:sex-regulated protein janus-A-like [Homalodisca vitripennis]|uniref:sex-regulated protein janus-A-like n=1 Tax=Homalodisca vitripennis TaxID=197043 RepID=UPI001EEBC98D|nr:sex-regulated protein janus-A-like [Homalodisca vitripennis]
MTNLVLFKIKSMIVVIKMIYFTVIKCIAARGFCKMTLESLEKVPNVEIDPEGVFKYILIKVYAKQTRDGNEPSKMIVRGNARGPYHADIYDEARSKIEPLGLDTECIGGGRINHDAAKKNILVYGYSQGFGKADHQITVDLLKTFYKDYNITYSNDGY